MSGASHEAFRFVSKRIMSGKGEWSEGACSDIYSIRIGFKLGSRTSVLQIVLAIYFVHPGSFDPWTRFDPAIIIARHFPTMLSWVLVYQFNRLADKPEVVFIVQFHSIDRVLIGAAPIQVKFIVLVMKGGIPHRNLEGLTCHTPFS